MSTLLISTCENKLSEREFVQPISRIIGGNHETLHYTQCTGSKISHFDKIIICGTALKDNSYLENLDTFKKLFYDFQGSILGICSGMQILGTSSEEGNAEGLNIIPGTIKKIPVSKSKIVPHVGWNNFIMVKSENILRNITEDFDFYYTHSFIFKTKQHYQW